MGGVMTVRAKFFVGSVTKMASQGGNWSAVEVKLEAARGDDNKDWAQATPSGELRMQIDNPEAASQFVAGECVVVTFEPSR